MVIFLCPECGTEKYKPSDIEKYGEDNDDKIVESLCYSCRQYVDPEY